MTKREARHDEIQVERVCHKRSQQSPLHLDTQETSLRQDQTSNTPQARADKPHAREEKPVSQKSLYLSATIHGRHRKTKVSAVCCGLPPACLLVSACVEVDTSLVRHSALNTQHVPPPGSGQQQRPATAARWPTPHGTCSRYSVHRAHSTVHVVHRTRRSAPGVPSPGSPATIYASAIYTNCHLSCRMPRFNAAGTMSHICCSGFARQY
jgi:hypothetical protein